MNLTAGTPLPCIMHCSQLANGLLLCDCLLCCRGHMYPVWDVAACPHGTYFVSAGADQTARMWSTEHPRPLRVFNGEYFIGAVATWTGRGATRRGVMWRDTWGEGWSCKLLRGEVIKGGPWTGFMERSQACVTCIGLCDCKAANWLKYGAQPLITACTLIGRRRCPEGMPA